MHYHYICCGSEQWFHVVVGNNVDIFIIFHNKSLFLLFYYKYRPPTVNYIKSTWFTIYILIKS